MKKKVLIITTAAVLLLTTVAFAAVDAGAAESVAAGFIPVGAKHLYTKTGSVEYAVQFIDESTNAHYEITVSRATGQIMELKMRIRGNPGSNTVVISEQQAKSILLKDHPTATIQSVKLETDNGYKRYHLDFSVGNTTKGNYEVNPETGVVIEKDVMY